MIVEAPRWGVCFFFIVGVVGSVEKDHFCKRNPRHGSARFAHTPSLKMKRNVFQYFLTILYRITSRAGMETCPPTK